MAATTLPNVSPAAPALNGTCAMPCTPPGSRNGTNASTSASASCVALSATSPSRSAIAGTAAAARTMPDSSTAPDSARARDAGPPGGERSPTGSDDAEKAASWPKMGVVKGAGDRRRPASAGCVQHGDERRQRAPPRPAPRSSQARRPASGPSSPSRKGRGLRPITPGSAGRAQGECRQRLGARLTSRICTTVSGGGTAPAESAKTRNGRPRGGGRRGRAGSADVVVDRAALLDRPRRSSRSCRR